MLRSSFVILLLASVSIGTQGELHWYIETYGNTSVTTIDSQLYAVSKNFSHISILSENNNYEPCDLELNITHVGRIQAVGIERKILLVYRQNATIVQMLQLDPILCLYTPLPNLETSVSSSLEPQLIVINNTLDVFVGGTNCLPCRLNVDGNRLALDGQLKEGNSSIFKSFLIQEFFQNGSVRNYVVGGNFENKTSVLMVFDQKFNKTKEIYYKYHQIEALAANSGFNGTYIGITYAGLGSPYERVLALYTGDLELIFETRLEKHSRGYKVFDTLLSIRSNGYSAVHSMQIENPSLPASSNYRYMNYAIYNSVGQLSRSGYFDNLRMDIAYDWQLFQYNTNICYAFHWSYGLSHLSNKSNIKCYNYDF